MLSPHRRFSAPKHDLIQLAHEFQNYFFLVEQLFYARKPVRNQLLDDLYITINSLFLPILKLLGFAMKIGVRRKIMKFFLIYFYGIMHIYSSHNFSSTKHLEAHVQKKVQETAIFNQICQ